MGLEPDTVMIDDADDGDGNVKDTRGDRRDIVKRPIGRRVEDRVAANCRQPCSFICSGHEWFLLNVGT